MYIHILISSFLIITFSFILLNTKYGINYIGLLTNEIQDLIENPHSNIHANPSILLENKEKEKLSKLFNIDKISLRQLSSKENISSFITIEHLPPISHNNKKYEEAISMVSTSNLYSGKWFINNSTNGTINIYFSKTMYRKGVKDNLLLFSIRIISGDYLYNWTAITLQEKNFKKNEVQSRHNISTSFNARVTKGKELFEISREYFCDAKVDFSFSDIKSNPKTNKTEYNKVIGKIKSKYCHINITFQAEKESDNLHRGSIYLYCVCLIVLIILHFFNTLWFNFKLEDSLTNANSISIWTLFQNGLWNSYSALSNFLLMMLIKKNVWLFATICLLYFINFSLFDLKLLFKVWSLKYFHMITDPSILRIKIVKLYVMYYLIMIISFIFTLRCYFDYSYVMINIFLMWTPQIYYNIKNQNRVSVPLIYYFIITANRLFPSLFFRGYKSNFLHLKSNTKFIIFEFLITLIIIGFLISQVIFGPRWFLPKRYKEGGFNFYKTEQELRILRPDIDSLECLICLENIINKANDNDDNKNISLDNKGICLNDINQNENSATDISVNINETAQLVNTSNSNYDDLDTDKLHINNENNEKNYKDSALEVINNNKNGNSIYSNDDNININNDKKLFFVSCIYSKVLELFQKLHHKISASCSCTFSRSPFTNFHQVNINYFKKPLMLTPCNHVFHSKCLEEWFNMKKECPSCRAEFTGEMFNI